MRNLMTRTRLVLAILAAIVIAGGMFACAPLPAMAQADSSVAPGLEGVAETIKLPDTDPRVIAARVINVALGLLAIIMVAIIVYAGFLYMTSGGDPMKTKTALAWIRNAVIGLVIILLSWAIARFVIEKLSEAAGVGAPGDGGEPGTPPGGFDDGGGGSFRVISITPSGDVGTRKVIVKIVFSRAVDEESANEPGNIVIERADGSPVQGAVVVKRNAVHFTPSEPCPQPNAGLSCFDEDADIRVRVSENLLSESGQELTCGGFAPECEGSFHTGSAVDVTPPQVSITSPLDGFPVPADALVDVAARAEDDVAVSYVSFFDQGEHIGDDAPVGSSPRRFSARVQWDTAGLAPGQSRALTATAYDADSGVATSDPVTVVIRPGHCFDGVQNQGETGIDCGGDPNSAEYCGACSGSQCTENEDCASGFCVDGFCVEQPVITSVDPDNGAVGTYVTIRGQNFGSNGSVLFLGSAGSQPVEAPQAQACVDEGISTWSSTQVIVEVPAGAGSGPVRITNNRSGLSDDTNAPPDPPISDFLVNNVIRPGICALVPDEASPSDLFRIIGAGFGNTSAIIHFGQSIIQSLSWSEQEIQAYVPNLPAGTYPVSVNAGGEDSNGAAMSVVPSGGGGAPEIYEIVPAQGPVGAYVTVSGRNFGSAAGQVFFMNRITEEVALADTDFPPECEGGYWSDRNIVVKVPRAFTQGGTGNVQPGPYAVWVRTARPAAPESNRENFAVNTDALAPGICAIRPSAGPVGTELAVHGEHLTSGPGTVRFYQNRIGETSSWDNRTIMTRIPSGAETGPVVAEPSSVGLTSNPYLVEVRNCNEAPGSCAPGEECCADGSCRPVGECPELSTAAMFAWQFSTGLIPRAPRVIEQCEQGLVPSPAPWAARPGGEEACVNDIIGILFSTRLDPTTVSGNTFLVYECGGSGSDPCGSREPLSVSPTVSQAGGEEQEGNDYVIIRPGLLRTSTWYEVVITAGVRGFGESGINMEEDASRCGAGNAYCFRFRTRESGATCEIGSVLVIPDPYTAREVNERISYEAVPRPEGDICRLLDCEPYDWLWDTDPPRADITNDRMNGRGSCYQTATARMETSPGEPVQVSALETGIGVAGAGDLTISFAKPRVVDHGPDCDTACVNTAVWAEFNIAMDPDSFTRGNIEILRCTNENCLEYDPARPSVDLSRARIFLQTVPDTSDTRMRFLKIEPLDYSSGSEPVFLLEPGRFYRVVLHSGTTEGIRSEAMVPLIGLNHPDGYSWTFRVKPGDAAYCTPDRIIVSPAEKYETRVGARQLFSANPFTAPDACSEKGQILIATGGYEWMSADPRVASLYLNGTVDTGSDLPPGCNANCTLKGAAGVYGKTAQCGNGVIETTDSAYCAGGVTVHGHACHLLDADGKGGEECDGQPGCNVLCLWDPVDTVNEGGTCGNGRIDAREDCDFGRTCMGAAPTSTTPDGRDCTIPGAEAECLANGGRCETRMIRGCSLNCRNLGSVAGGSSCGNGDKGDGEDCDDGNGASGDGCSSNCLHEGSKPASRIYALCGNGVIESGEACEAQGGSFPAGCDPRTCLHTGRAPCLVSQNQPNPSSCCGNGVIESGEDCDNGNSVSGDGCSSLCLFEGSSHLYDEPSFCGDGILGMGEARSCEEASAGDGLIDGSQLAVIVGEADLPPGEEIMSTEISAAYEGKTGTAVYGLRCGFDDERLCSESNTEYDHDFGLTAEGCCAARPAVADSFPLNGETDVCRNVLVRGAFNVKMDERSVTNNFLLAKRVEGNSCPEGTADVTRSDERFPGGFRGLVLRLWNRFLGLFGIRTASAQVWCAGSATGVLQFGEGLDANNEPVTTFAYTLDAVLEPDTAYRVLFRGDPDLSDNRDTANRTGMQSERGVVSDRDYEWTFATGREVCVISEIRVKDDTAEHPNLFLSAQEAHPFIASALSMRNGRPVYISTTDQYEWEWKNWALSNNRIATLEPSSEPPSALSSSMRTVISTEASGSGFVSARVLITTDSVSVPSTAGRVVQGTAPITVLACENPWPSRRSAPFRDQEGSPSLDGTLFENGPFYNFSMTYCRDAGAPGPNGDLPALQINAVRPNPADSAQGIMRQYLFSFSEPELKKDAIGMRIAMNPLHLSPVEWYRSKGFTGAPEEIQVDGYEAIRDGRTVYVSAMNTEDADQPMYSNIYVISYNDGAEPVTREIFDALLETLTFNTNLQEDVARACQRASGDLITSSDGLPVPCGADWECYKYGDDAECANFKQKVQRDMIRLGDFQEITRALEQAKKRDGAYPRLAAGSYLPGVSTSMWPSWSAALTESAGGAFPSDPVNRFVTCGRCSESRTACVRAEDCPRDGEACVSEEGFDSVTCWNAESLQYRCPVKDASGTPSSRLYQYRSLSAGARFELASEFEVPPPNPSDPSQNWWTPPLFEEIRQCASPEQSGWFCQTDADCGDVVGACKAVGGRYRYSNVCQGQVYGQSSTCGDGIIDSNPDNLECLGGPNDGRSCQSSADCASSPCEPAEICELSGPSSFRFVSCTTLEGANGQKRQVCDACRSYADDTGQPGCFALKQCGNGRTDGVCANDPSAFCASSADCNGAACDLETCDDGALNGTYGHCNSSCTGYAGYCGDGKISLGEFCDHGFTGSRQNMSWCGPVCSDPAATCNLSCTGHAPYCGDGTVNLPYEECDGNSESTDRAVCVDGAPSDGGCASRGGILYEACEPAHVCVGAGGFCDGTNTPCSSDGECASGLCVSVKGRVCSPSSAQADCGAATCSEGTVPTVRSRSCLHTSSQGCIFGEWESGCHAAEYCGNGVLEGNEQCDDGNADNADGCTVFCARNVCGDGLLFEGVEECDLGEDNGTPCQTAEYGSTCSSCSRSCKLQLTQGGFCGDGIVSPGSAEQCDTAGDPDAPVSQSSLTCRALGYDYAARTQADNSDLITCSQSCTYTGCAFCGDVPAGTDVSSNPLYQGHVEGTLFDTLFQQPVPGARITLFYRGLQVAVTTSDDEGFFSFSNMDRHDGCNQYRMVIDSYGDNPRTLNFDESLRQGYEPVETPPFEPHYNTLAENNDPTKFTRAMLNWGADTEQVTEVTNPRNPNITVPRFNLLPRLGENEYIVQFWWNPDPGNENWYEDTIAAYRNNPSAFLTSMTKKYHDLMIRLPFTYVPGSFGRCALSPQPIAFDNTKGDICYNRVSGWGSAFEPECMSVDHGQNITDNEERFNFILKGMESCTNKIRATSAKTCRKSDGTQTGLPCSSNWDCRLAGNYGMSGATCTDAPESSRSGPIEVLEGAEGAYLFCFHPEYETLQEQQSPDCRNFVVPPQSAFITGKGGVYDIIVSQFYMFGASGSYGTNAYEPQRVTKWLYDHDAKIMVYYQYGMYGRWNFREITSGLDMDAKSDIWPPEWTDGPILCPNGTTDEGIYGTGEELEAFYSDAAGPYPSGSKAPKNLHMTYAGGVNQYWVPISIDTTNRVVRAWDSNASGRTNLENREGYHMAAYRYFADTYSRDVIYSFHAGNGGCWYETCNDRDFEDARFPPSGWFMCNGAYYTGSPNSPPCDANTRQICQQNWPEAGCAVQAVQQESNGVRCVKFCSTNGSYDGCEGVVANSAGAAEVRAFCGGRSNCSSSGGVER
jgi:cysteine-rich repeat protein